MFKLKNENVAIPVVLIAGILWSFGPLVVRYMDQPELVPWQYLFARGITIFILLNIYLFFEEGLDFLNNYKKIKNNKISLYTLDGQIELKFQSKAWLRKQIIYKDKDNRQQIGYGKKFQNFNEFLKKGDVILLKKQDTIYSISQIPKVNGAIVVIDPNTGRVLAMTGGYQFTKSEFNRATQALRQPGSAFKPFIYAAALDLGYSPNSIFFDEPTEIEIEGSKIYSPKNYTGEYLGPVTLNQALSGSINTVAVKLANEIGIEKIRAIANDFGIRSRIGKGLAVALGSSEVNLLELTSAYAGFLSSGKKVNPIGWFDLKIRGEKGVLMSADRSEGMQVIDQNASAALLYMLYDVVENGTGNRAKIPGWDIAGKTGTSQLMKDAWFIGFNTEYVCGIWMGYDNNTPLKGVTGGGLPAELWSNIIKQLIKQNTPSSLPYLIPEEFEKIAGQRKDDDKLIQQDKKNTSMIRALLDTLFGN